MDRRVTQIDWGEADLETEWRSRYRPRVGGESLSKEQELNFEVTLKERNVEPKRDA